MRRARSIAAAAILAAATAGAHAANLEWDVTTGTPGAQGGTGTWNTTNTFWWNGTSNVAWNNANLDTAIFGATAGTVTVGGAMTVGGFVVDTASYIFTIGSTNNVKIQGPFTINQPITVNLNGSGVSSFTDAIHWQRGLQFYDNVTIPSNVTLKTGGSVSGIIGITGANKVLSFAGVWDAGTSNPSRSRVALAGGAKLLVKAGAQINNNMPDAINARPWEIATDGNVDNVVEFEEGFDADIAHNYTMGDGLSTFRIGTNVTWITHTTANLPSIYKLGSGGTFNTHHGLIAFDSSNPNSRWVVASNSGGTDQYYDGRVVYSGNWTLETQSNLIHDGWIHGSLANPYGANVPWISTGGTMTKTGTGSLVLAGSQGYQANAAYNIQQGSIRFETDPAMLIPGNGTVGQLLTVNVTGAGVADFNLAVGAPTWYKDDGTGTATYNPNPPPGEARTGPAGPAPTQGSVLTLNLSTGGTVRVASGKTVNTINLSASSGAGNLNIEGTGRLVVGGATPTATVASGAALAKAGGGSLVLTSPVVMNLSAANASLDVQRGAVVFLAGSQINTTGSAVPASFANIAALVAAADIAGYPSSAKLTSTAAAGNAALALGTIIGSAAVGPVAGYTLAANDVAVLATLRGDATCDGTVNFNDLLVVSQNYNAGGKVWYEGDVNYDGLVNFNDLLALSQNYNQSYTSPAAAPVPEPGMGVVLGLAMLALGARRRREQ